MEKLLDSKALASILSTTHKQITKAKVDAWGLPVVRLHRRRLFRQSDVEKLIERYTIEPSMMSKEGVDAVE